MVGSGNDGWSEGRIVGNRDEGRFEGASDGSKSGGRSSSTPTSSSSSAGAVVGPVSGEKSSSTPMPSSSSSVPCFPSSIVAFRSSVIIVTFRSSSLGGGRPTSIPSDVTFVTLRPPVVTVILISSSLGRPTSDSINRLESLWFIRELDSVVNRLRLVRFRCSFVCILSYSL